MTRSVIYVIIALMFAAMAVAQSFAIRPAFAALFIACSVINLFIAWYAKG